jgi:hypothetical protein
MNEQAGKSTSGWTRIILLVLSAVVALTFLAVFTTDLRLSYDLIASPCEGEACHYQAITEAEAAVLKEAGLSVEAYAVYILGATVVTVLVYTSLAVLLLWRLYPQRLGFLFSVALVILPTTSITSFDVVARAYPAFQNLVIFLFGFGGAFSMFFYVTFPNGRLVPRWSIIIPILWSLSSISDIIGALNGKPPAQDGLLVPLVIGLLLAIIVVISYRYRRLFSPTERQQAKWVLFGLVVNILGVPVWGYTYVFSNPAPGEELLLTYVVGWTLAQVMTLFLAGGIVIAILRYRLWDIDLIVRRTLVYGTVTALLAAVYFGSVVMLQNVVIAVAGRSSPAIIVVSTLIIAGLFNPLRRGVQQIIDRRFYRQKYDAALTLQAFAQTARDEVDLDQLSRALVQSVQETMRPERISLWLKDVD